MRSLRFVVLRMSGLLCFGLGEPMFSGFRFVQGGNSDAESVADLAAFSRQVTDPGLSAPALLGDLHLSEPPRGEV